MVKMGFVGCAIAITASLFALPTAQAQTKPLIAFSVSGTTNPFYASMAQGVREEAAKQGLEALILDAQDKAEKQASDIEDARTRGIKALLINPVNASVAPVVANVIKAGIPVFTVQRNLPDLKVASHVGANNVLIGEQLIAWWAKSVGGKESKILIMTGTPGAASSEDRIVGIKNTLPKHPNLKVLAMQTGYYDRARALPVAENMLQAHPDAEAILCLNDNMAMGVLAAAKGKAIKIVGIDANPDAVQAVAQGALTMTIALAPARFGALGTELAAKKLKGEAVPESILSEQILFITKDNAATYKP
ncbi:substrate-binding domain-containing protein [Xanthobacteraceae bacterium Astr-EGSB]|uniref:sugar ABC transporter substrate-binding protein n=1 Tax=Astrobacterium formosum TaxID=3069710 RepID=UPI0027B4B76E|nr:substrate-binding domain-containing protein [Xanthobacteraceae bacterium Astr-EGSB]